LSKKIPKIVKKIPRSCLILYFSLKINIPTIISNIPANDFAINELISGVLKYLSKFIITRDEIIVIHGINNKNIY